MTEEEIGEIVARVIAELDSPTPEPQAVTLGHLVVAPGMTILADHINSLASQAVPKYPNAAARNASWPSPPDGAMCWMQDSNVLMVYTEPITGGPYQWMVAGGARQGYSRMGSGQVIPGGSVDTVIRATFWGGAANAPGRAAWASDGTVTLPYTGTYLVSGNIVWPANNTGERRLYIKRFTANAWTFQGVAGGVTEVNTGAVGSTLLRMGVSAMVLAAAGEKVALVANHSASTSLTLPTGVEDQGKLGVHLLAGDE